MKTFIANFGPANVLWPECLKRPSVATFEDADLRPLWEAGDREAYIEKCMATRTTVRGIKPTRPVASRWFNLATIITTTANDLWIHREKDELWWTMSLPGEVIVEERPAFHPNSVVPTVFVLHKPAAPWSNKTRTGARLDWKALHPKAREFLFTEGTLQQPVEDNAAYAHAFIDGASLEKWHSKTDWKTKADATRRGIVTMFDAKRKAVVRMAMTAFNTAAQSNGQQVVRTVKNKEVRFSTQLELERYVDSLVEAQEGLCAITELPLGFDGEADDLEMLASLDRIDSNGHYEVGNLQVVCRFVNRWKSDSNDAEFRRLIAVVQRA